MSFLLTIPIVAVIITNWQIGQRHFVLSSELFRSYFKRAQGAFGVPSFIDIKNYVDSLFKYFAFNITGAFAEEVCATV